MRLLIKIHCLAVFGLKILICNLICIKPQKYQIIYADPPWSYNDKLLGKSGACNKYDVMNLQDICGLNVSQIAADNCILFMWVTMPHLEDAFKVISSWGFTYKTCAFTWIKQNKKSDSLFWGLGRWTRSNPELCLLAIRGNPKAISHSVHSVILSKLEEHSKNQMKQEIG